MSAIITAIDGRMFDQFYQDFYLTLRNVANFKKKLCVIDYGLTPEQRAKIEDAQFFPRTLKAQVVSNQRMIHYLEVMKEISDETVLLIDSGDIWFQDSIDELFVETPIAEIYCVEEVATQSIYFNELCMNQTSKETQDVLRPVLQGKPLINAGMLAGRKEMMIALFEEAVSFWKEHNYDFFAYDQLILNYILRKKDWAYPIEQKYNFVVINNEGQIFIRDKLFYLKSGEKVKIVHNAGGQYRRIKQPYNQL